jgi:O-antigen/teichoic acid export membrane protein
MNTPESPPPRYSLRHLLKGASLYGIADVAVMGVRFGLLALYTRSLAPRDFGTLAVFQTTILLACVLISQGLPYALLIRYKQVSGAHARTLKDTTFWTLLLLCAATALILLGGFHLLPAYSPGGLLPWLLLWGSATVLGPVAADSLRIEEKIGRYGIARIGRVAATAFIVIRAFGAQTLELGVVVQAEAIGMTVEVVLSMLLDRYIPGRPSLRHWRSLWKMGLPLCTISMGFFIIDLSDRYIVQLFMGAEATGYYATAARIAIGAAFVAEAFNAMWTPYYYRLAGGDALTEARFRRLFDRLVLLFAVGMSLLMLVLPLLVHLKAFGRFFIDPRYHRIAIVVPVLVLSYFFKICFYLVSAPIEFSGRGGVLSRALYVGVSLNVLGNLIVAALPFDIPVLTRLRLIAAMTGLSYLLCTHLGVRNVEAAGGGRGIGTASFAAAAGVLVPAVLPLPFALRWGVWLPAAAGVVLYLRPRHPAGEYVRTRERSQK